MISSSSSRLLLSSLSLSWLVVVVVVAVVVVVVVLASADGDEHHLQRSTSAACRNLLLCVVAIMCWLAYCCLCCVVCWCLCVCVVLCVLPPRLVGLAASPVPDKEFREPGFDKFLRTSLRKFWESWSWSLWLLAWLLSCSSSSLLPLCSIRRRRACFQNMGAFRLSASVQSTRNVRIRKLRICQNFRGIPYGPRKSNPSNQESAWVKPSGMQHLSTELVKVGQQKGRKWAPLADQKTTARQSQCNRLWSVTATQDHKRWNGKAAKRNTAEADGTAILSEANKGTLTLRITPEYENKLHQQSTLIAMYRCI